MNLDHFAAVAARVTVWHASLPESHPRCFTCPELTAGTGLTMRQLHAPLLMLGWSRAAVWSRRNNRSRCRILWAPPGCTVPRLPRGRPPFIVADYTPIDIT